MVHLWFYAICYTVLWYIMLLADAMLCSWFYAICFNVLWYTRLLADAILSSWLYALCYTMVHQAPSRCYAVLLALCDMLHYGTLGA